MSDYKELTLQEAKFIGAIIKAMSEHHPCECYLCRLGRYYAANMHYLE